MNKKILVLFSSAAVLLLGALVLPLSAFAQLKTYGQEYSLTNIVDGAANAVWVLFTLIVIVCFVYAGIMFLTAQGEASKLQTARSAVLWGIVGVIVGILAYVAIDFVGNLLS